MRSAWHWQAATTAPPTFSRVTDRDALLQRAMALVPPSPTMARAANAPLATLMPQLTAAGLATAKAGGSANDAKTAAAPATAAVTANATAASGSGGSNTVAAVATTATAAAPAAPTASAPTVAPAATSGTNYTAALFASGAGSGNGGSGSGPSPITPDYLVFPSAATAGAPPHPPPQIATVPLDAKAVALANTASTTATAAADKPGAGNAAGGGSGAGDATIASLSLPPGTIITTLPTPSASAGPSSSSSAALVVPQTAAPPVMSLAPAGSKPSSDKRGSILIICTGGTFAMHRHSDGVLRPTVNALEAMLRSLDELKHPDIPTFDLVEWAEPMDSSDFSPGCWVQLAHQIEQNYYAYDGFVILHGTDTMSYTASALSFMLENLAKTVVLTGAMSPLEAPISDAKRNLIISMFVAANSEIPECLIFFDSVLLRGNRAKKIDPWVTAAFQSPNLEPLGEMGVKVSFRRSIFLPSPRGRFRIHTQLFSNIAVMTMIPGFDDTVIQSFVAGSKGRCAIVLCLYGAGNAPTKKKDFLDVIRYSREVKQAVIVITSQCLRGSVDMTQYATGIQLSQMGVIDGKDMTTEACVTKLAYLMGRGLQGAQLKLAMESNLRGELTVNEKRTYAKQSNEADFMSKL